MIQLFFKVDLTKNVSIIFADEIKKDMETFDE